MTSIYLDYNATAPVYPEAADLLRDVLSMPANASSVHSYGRSAKKLLEDARKTIADAVSAWPNEVIFTVSGTEANITALRGVAGHRVLVSAIEHSSVLKSIPEAAVIPVDKQGIIDLSALDAMLVHEQPALVSLMLANNETGVIQPVAEAAGICKKHNALLHCDAVQGLGKIAFDFGSLGADMMTISGHKCGAPVGAAALIIRRELPFQPLMTGGGQESNRRAGTENIAAICAFAKTVEKASDLSHMRKVRDWLDAMEAELESLGAVVFGKGAPRLPNTSCIAMPGAGNEVQLMDFDLKGVAVSAGSACSSGRIEGSHVLTAMGVPKELVLSAIRVSAGWQTTESDILRFAEIWKQLQLRLKINCKIAS
jgi:cysteine desulfurase